MIIVEKYDKNGSLTAKEFESKFKAFLWLNDNLSESEWCWIMYKKKGENDNGTV